MHSPAYWKNFFTPGSALTLFGKPIAGLEDIDVAVPAAARGLARDHDQGKLGRDHAGTTPSGHCPGVSGIIYTATGQTNYAFIERK